VLTLVIGKALSTKPYKGPRTSHFNGKRFKNPSRRSAKGFKDVFKYIVKGEKDRWSKIDNPFVRDTQVEDANSDEIKVHFVNHSTFLIQIGEVNILTDPIWSDYCSPLPLPMLKRKRPPGISFDKLPRIDLVLISHNHYDHLDKKSIHRISKNHKAQAVTCLGNSPAIRAMGIEQTMELDWWQKIKIGEVEIEAVPANHFSSRGTFDRNTSLWCGFILRAKGKQLYFIGDTGYGNIFKEIGQKYGAIDLALIPIGAFKPRWFMGPIHISPEEAVAVHQDIKSKKSIAMHYGTFALADDSPQRAIKEFEEAKKLNGISDEEFFLLEEGRCYDLS